MKEKARNIFLLLLCCNLSLIGQRSETDNLRTIKLAIFTEMDLGILTSDLAIKYINQELIGQRVEQRGFIDVIFYKIPSQDLIIDTTLKEITKYQSPLCLKENGCEYIVGINIYNGKVFKLKGFKDNDFEDLYVSLTASANRKQQKNISNNSIKHFVMKYKVDGLDFDCLMHFLKKGTKKGNCLDSIEYDMTVY